MYIDNTHTDIYMKYRTRKFYFDNDSLSKTRLNCISLKRNIP